ncbi:N-acetylmuramidase domain-containing protein [Gemmata sp. JC673]|uniref:N-acetylmuramidase domain-containing protein n=1 Tax=Gemmata algarum TaxID=2975278 RepID=A0ABU5F3E3_9BACT|nr:N-acetylmuramidase domain-containing protein [Gemmata algarum]MDY3562102.1 N-acetylmuramidase domain-containing protein [Gemmata algarum]
MSRFLLLGAVLAGVCASAAGADPSPEFAVIGMDAQIRTDPPKLAPSGKRAPYGGRVTVLEEKTVDGKVYAKVQQSGGAKTVYGWTAKTNLGSPKEFDPAMAPGDEVDTETLKGIDAVMGSIYNARGKYLFDRAKELGASPAALAAVLKVESGGRGFGPDGRTIVRFENHTFWGQWGKAHKDTFDAHFKFNPDKGWLGHQWRKTAAGPWVDEHKNQAGEWEVLEFAQTLDKPAALKSASYGAGQIMGFNHKTVGYATVEEMVKAFDRGIGPQLDGIIAFIKTHPNCLKGLKENDFTLFAGCYNGRGKEAEYGRLIKDAAEAYTKVTRGKTLGG